MKFIYNHKSPNFNKRKSGSSIKYIIIHYTAIKNSNEAIKHLCYKKNKVSSHFLIDKEGEIFNLVNLKKRAWHAGRSCWLKDFDINSQSIGIELDNSGHHLYFEKFSNFQIKSLIRLIKFLKRKYNIEKKSILGHSDISPYRKIDPGEKFPWKKIYKENLVFWPSKVTTRKYQEINKDLNFLLKKNSKRLKALYMLNKIGYDTKLAKKNNKDYIKLITVYQMHYRQALISGKLDAETYSLICSHYNDMLT